MKLFEIYKQKNFPFEIRGLFHEWIESQLWHEIDEHTEEGNLRAVYLLKQMMELIDLQARKPEDLMSQMRFYDHKKMFCDNYKDQHMKFVKSIQEILLEEKQMLNVAQLSYISLDTPQHMDQQANPAPSQSQSQMTNNNQEMYNRQNDNININEILTRISSDTMKLDQTIKDYKQHQESFIIQYQDICKIEADIKKYEMQPQSSQRDHAVLMLTKQKTDTETTLRSKASHMLSEREYIINTLKSLVEQGSRASLHIFEALLEWRGQQQRSLSGAASPSDLDELQGWFETACDVLWQFYTLGTHYKLLFEALPITKHGQEKEDVENLLKDIVTNLSTVIMRSFIVDKQPPQVMKTQTKFQASVRLLVGSKLNLQLNAPEVTVSILSEKQCKELVAGQTLEEIGTCGDILNEKCVMEKKEGGILQSDFKNLQLKKIKRQDRKGQESVLEAKSALVFSSVVTIGGDKLPVVCMSVPVVVVVHGNQGPNSEATVIWDNMFSDIHRQPFDVPEEVPWKLMYQALNLRWKMSCGSELQPEHLMYQREKLFLSLGSIDHIPPDHPVPWSLFNKEPIKGRTFTYWEWFHGAMEVVKKNLKDYWLQGCLEFISRQNASERLCSKPAGTFLIRFSEGVIGAVCIAWCKEKERNGRKEKEILFVQPWSAKDFNIRNLADRIFDIPQLTHVYPDIPKEEAFGALRSNEDFPQGAVDPSGYVLSGIVARILPSQENQGHSQQQRYHNYGMDMGMNEWAIGSPHQSTAQMSPVAAYNPNEGANSLNLPVSGGGGGQPMPNSSGPGSGQYANTGIMSPSHHGGGAGGMQHSAMESGDANKWNVGGEGIDVDQIIDEIQNPDPQDVLANTQYRSASSFLEMMLQQKPQQQPQGVGNGAPPAGNTAFQQPPPSGPNSGGFGGFGVN